MQYVLDPHFLSSSSVCHLQVKYLGQATHCRITNGLFEVFYFIYMFISMQCALYPHFPSSIPFAIRRRNSAKISKN